MTHTANVYREAATPASRESRLEFEKLAFAALQDRFGATLDSSDQWGLTAVLDRSRLREALTFLRDDPSMRLDMLLDTCGVDYLEYPGHDLPRFAVVYILKSLVAVSHRLRLKVWVEEDDLVVPSVHDLFASADWQERETWDQFGIVFEGHPNLRRLLNHCDFVGHPLRKDYPAQRRQWLLANDPMIDQLEARLRSKGYEILESPAPSSPSLEETSFGRKK